MLVFCLPDFGWGQQGPADFVGITFQSTQDVWMAPVPGFEDPLIDYLSSDLAGKDDDSVVTALFKGQNLTIAGYKKINGLVFYNVVNEWGAKGWVVDHQLRKDLKGCDQFSDGVGEMAKEIEKVARDRLRATGYETCNQKNNYLEEFVLKAGESQEDLRGDLNPMCTLLALKMGQPNRYRHCVNGRRQGSMVRPCVSESYHKLIHNSFVKLSKCLGEDPRELFPLIATESHFFSNNLSKTDAKGIAMLTDGNIDFYNANPGYFTPYLKRLEENGCGELQKKISEEKLKSNVCDPIDIPKNPMLNLFYGYMKFLMDKRDIAYLAAKELAGDEHFLNQHPDVKSLVEKRRSLERERVQKNKKARATDAKTLETIQKRLNEIKYMLEVELPSQTYEALRRDSELNKLFTEGAYYAFNWGTAGFRSVMTSFLASKGYGGIQNFGKFTGSDGSFVKFANQNRSILSDDLGRFYEMINHVHIAIPYQESSPKGKKKVADGGLSSITKNKNDLNEKVRALNEDGEEPPCSLY